MPGPQGSAAPPSFKIFVNGDEKTVHEQKLSFDHIVELAFPGAPHGGNVRYTVEYTEPGGKEGSLVRGQHVDVIEGMTFDVDNTDKS